MSHFLDRLKFMSRVKSTYADGHGAVVNEDRKWEYDSPKPRHPRLPPPFAGRPYRRRRCD